jgi:hypothetical protein
MADVGEIWKSALPAIQGQLTGRGVWAALNAAIPVLFEDGVFVAGLDSHDSELSGHLRIPATTRLIETTLTKVLQTPTRFRLIDGTTKADYEVVKRRDIERRRLQEAELTKMRAELESRTSWDAVYEQLSRRYSAMSNKSLPQNRARYFEEAIGIIIEARQAMTNFDESSERTFARCIERVAQYTEVPSTIIALTVLQRSGEI